MTPLAFSQENIISAKTGETFVIELDSNITTGYSWQLAKPLKKEFIRLVSSEYINLHPNVTGAGGKEIWRFITLKKGSTKISFQYSRPWEKQRPAKQISYKIKVK